MSELTPPAADRDPRASAALATLEDWSRIAEHAYAPNTLRAWRADWDTFHEYCRERGLDSMPAEPATVRGFVFACIGLRKKPATIRRYVATLARAHRAAGVPDPTVAEPVKLALKEMGRTIPSRQRQARGLLWAEIANYLTVAPLRLRDYRDRALVTVAYDTLCRREELTELQIEDVKYDADGSGTVLIRRCKADQTGQGATAYLAPLTMRLLKQWLSAAGLDAGPLFYALGAGQTPRAPLTAAAVSDTFKRIGRWLHLPPDQINALSGHSVRVGATQDLLALNIDLASVMQAGRWKDTRMPMRYGEHALAKQGGMARAARVQGRA